VTVLNPPVLSRPPALQDPHPLRMRVAYFVSRFPKLTETFVINEIHAVEKQGVDVGIYPLFGQDNGRALKDGASIFGKAVEILRKPSSGQVMHEHAKQLLSRVVLVPFLSWSVIASQFHMIFRSPSVYFGTLWKVIRGTWGNTNFLVGGLVIFPKTVYLARQLEKAHVQHLHAHFANHPTTAAFIVHQLTRIPYSFTAHGSDLHRDQHMLNEKVAAAEFVVTISQYNYRFIAQRCGPAAARKVKVIHCGVDTSLFRAQARNRVDAAGAALHLVSVGTLHEVKGQTVLVEACRILQQRGVDFQCSIVGDGPDRQKLERQISEYGLTDRVFLLGLRDRSAIIQLLQTADVFTSPSVVSQSGRREGIPVVLIEAMACGVPVVASDLSGIPELVHDEKTGLLVTPGNPAELANRFVRLFEDSALRTQLGQAGREMVEREFDLDHNAQTLVMHFLREGTTSLELCEVNPRFGRTDTSISSTDYRSCIGSVDSS
jgi:glycosyltransferase involved in cell wall biosynthesis